MRWAITFWLCSVILANAASIWYVDSAATGANNGTSWADAWNEMDQINWTGISAGHTVYLSGGTYTTQLRCSKSGTAANPIWIRASQESGHNSLIVVSNQIQLDGNYVTLYGAKVDDPGTNNIVPDALAAMLATNCNISISHPSNSNGGVYLTGQYDQKVFWVNSSANGSAFWGTNLVNPDPPAEFKTCHGIQHKTSSAIPCYGIEVGWCLTESNNNDGILIYQNVGETYGQVKVHHCVSRYNLDDGIQSAGGIDISYCLLGPTPRSYWWGHIDTIQLSGRPTGYVRIFNNVLYQGRNSWILFESEYRDAPNAMIYGNCFRILQNWQTDGGHPNYMLHMSSQPYAQDPSGATNLVYTNCVIVNNSMAGAFTPAILFNIAPAHSVTVSNGVYIANNIAYGSCTATASGQESTGAIWCKGTNDGKYMFYGEDTVYVDYNNVSGWNNNLGFQGTAYLSPSEFNSAFGWIGNTDDAITFEDTNTLVLAASDTGARNRGIDLNSLLPAGILAQMPDYNVDMNGNVRGAEGLWDIGAYEVPHTGLVAWFTFDEDFSGGTITDQTGNGHDIVAMDDSSTNRWPQSAAGTNGNSAFFYMYYDGFGAYNRSGDYGAITNVDSLFNLTTATFSAWVYYTNAVTNYWPNAQTARIMDTGYNTNGAWSWGRNDADSAMFTSFWICTNATTGLYRVVTWDGLDNCNSYGSTSNFNHYAISVDCTSGNAFVTNYFNGAYVGYGIASNVNFLTGPTPASCDPTNRYPWIAIGCGTHANTAPLRDCDPNFFPNTGWMQGSIDDLRIYNRILSASEIVALAGEPAAPPDPTPSLARVQNLRVVNLYVK